MRVSGLILVVLVLSGCHSASVSRNFTLDPDEDAGIVIVGSVGEEYDRAVSFSAYDEETEDLRSSPFHGISRFTHRKAGGPVQYHVLKMPAGPHVFKQVHYKNYFSSRSTTVCFGSGTFKFDVLPGKIIYIGNLEVSPIGMAPRDPEAARRVLAAYANLDGEVIDVELVPARFNQGTDLFGAPTRACGGYYKK